MKKTISLIIVIILLLTSFSFAESEDVTVTIPGYDVTVNGVKIDIEHSQYPVISYRDITYLPMTSDYLSGFGLMLSFNGQDGLTIDVSESIDSLKQNFVGVTNIIGSKHTASIVPFEVTVNGNPIDNSNEKYPILLYKNITYFPLTWRFAVTEFAWKTHWSNTTGFSISIEKEHFFEIRKIEDLFEVNNYPDETFKLITDLDFNDSNDYYDTEVYLDYIRDKSLPVDLILKSKLDGNGKTISNLTVSKSNQDEVALFKKIDNGAIVQDLKIVNFEMSGNNNIALLTTNNFGTIKNVEVTGTINGERTMAGIAALNYNTIKDSKANISITGNNTYDVTRYFIGGIAGKNKGVIERVVTYGTIDGYNSLGGIVGTNLNILRNAVSNVNMTSSNEDGDHTGGIVGINDGGRIEKVIAYGNVIGHSYTGGVAGSNLGGLILNSVAANNSISGARNVSAVIGINKDSDTAVYGAHNNYYFSNIPLSAIRMNTDLNTMGLTVNSNDFVTLSQDMGFWNTSLGSHWDFQSIWQAVNNQIQLRE